MTTKVDGTQLYEEAMERIRQLEQQCATLAAQVDRQGKVVEAAIDWADTEYGTDDENSAAAVLVEVVSEYEQEIAELTGEG